MVVLASQGGKWGGSYKGRGESSRVVQMWRVAVGRSAGAYTQAAGTRSREEWCIHIMGREVLVWITAAGKLVHADGQEEVLVLGEEVWEEWNGQAVEGTD